ncbi:hypothetical protein [Limnohabitans sp. T6-20]|uniref:hypothetical protein n=1 Tax=Limnohabitans sp. T6-20 TaxID=1100725 RepID=UPI001304CE0E|nr:hypothetical protein [Limnohabitans sp. T6-20]
MFDLAAPDTALGILVVAVAILYSAWHDYRAGNSRDARLLTTLGAVSLMGGTLAWFQ